MSLSTNPQVRALFSQGSCMQGEGLNVKVIGLKFEQVTQTVPHDDFRVEVYLSNFIFQHIYNQTRLPRQTLPHDICVSFNLPQMKTPHFRMNLTNNISFKTTHHAVVHGYTDWMLTIFFVQGGYGSSPRCRSGVKDTPYLN